MAISGHRCKMRYDFGTPLNTGRLARRGIGRPRATPIRQRRNPRKPHHAPAGEAADIPRHHRVRRHRGAADRQCRPLAPQLHPARPPRAGQEPYPPGGIGSARSGDSRGAGVRDPRRPAGAALFGMPRACRRGRRRPPDRLAAARGALRREARHARRDDRGHDRRPRSHQGRPRRAPALRRADDALRAAAAGQPGHLRDQRAAGPRRQDPGRPVQHPPGRRRPDQGLSRPPAARRAARLQREPRGLHRARQDHHAAQGPDRLGDPHPLPRDPPRRHGDHRAGSVDGARKPGAGRDPGLRARGRRGSRLPGAPGLRRSTSARASASGCRSRCSRTSSRTRSAARCSRTRR